MTVKIFRQNQNDKQTVGNLFVYNKNEIVFSCKTLELPYRNNQKEISCIPAGSYHLIKHNSKKFGKCFSIEKVYLRTAILIHAGNTYHDTKGCILVGEKFADINKDGYPDLINSKQTLDTLLKILPNTSHLIITDPISQ